MEDIWIKRVEITNFRSHKQTNIDFVKGTNALIGTSNSGKSAAIRAIRWCLINVPSGTEFITVGEKEAAVKVFLSNGKTIERRRNRSSVNLYRLYEDGELKEEYTGFGSGVPPEIKEAHGIVPIAGDLYFQFAHQLEAPFMLSLKPKQRAEVLGNLDELARIDKALTDTNDDVRIKGKQKKELEKEEKNLALEQARLKAETERLTSKVDVLKTLKSGLESKMQLRGYLTERLERLKEIRTVMAEVGQEVEKAKRITGRWPDDLEERIAYFSRMKEHLLRLKEMKEELQSIRFMKKDKLDRLEAMKEEVEQKVERFKKIDTQAKALRENQDNIARVRNSFSTRIAEMDISRVDTDVTRYKVLFNHLERLRAIDKSTAETDKMVKQATERIDELLSDFVHMLHEAELCPTCGQGTHEVCEETVETII